MHHLPQAKGFYCKMNNLYCPECGVHVDEHEANACFDNWIALGPMGWERMSEYSYSPTWLDREDASFPTGKIYTWEPTSYPMFRPSTDIAAAWQVVEKMRKNGWAYEISLSDSGEEVCIWKNPLIDFSGYGEGIYLAICRAAIKACVGK